MMSEQWVAATASSASYLAHRLVGWGQVACGERHYNWRPVEWFANPLVFDRCPLCAAPTPPKETPDAVDR